MAVDLTQLVLLIASLASLALAANAAVGAISKFSSIVGISEVSAGLVIVSIATSLPELTVAAFSATTGNIAITLGDVFGSNVTDVTLVAGVLLLLSPLHRIEDRPTVVALSRQLLVVSLIPFLLLVVRTGDWTIGLVLLAAFSYFIYRTLKTDHDRKGREKTTGSPLRQLVIFSAMIVIVIVSARYIVSSASVLAAETGLRKSVIGASIVAMGTSLPELTVDSIAVRRGHLGLALGDVIGSCVANITLVLGVALSLSPVVADFTILAELVFSAAATPFLMFLVVRRGKVTRWRGLLLAAVYVAFIAAMYTTQAFVGAP